MVEDVVTTGGSTVKAIERVREDGFEVVGVMSVLDRLAGGGEAITAAATARRTRPLTTIDDVYPERRTASGGQPGVDQPPGDRVRAATAQLALAGGGPLHLLALEPADLRELVVAGRGSSRPGERLNPSISELGNGHGWEAT